MTVSSFVSLLDRMKQHPTLAKTMKLMPDTVIPLRVHHDVVRLASDLAERDAEKLHSMMPLMFMPAEDCWFEWPMGDQGDMGVLFLGRAINRTADGGVRLGNERSITQGEGIFYAWRHKGEDDGPTAVPLVFDLTRRQIGIAADILATMPPQYQYRDPIVAAQALNDIRPAILAFLALINNPKLVRRDPAKLERLNRKRAAAGRYTYHPHHCVRLNVDQRFVRVGPSHGGDGASRALHFVRAHLRLVDGVYYLVRPHMRGDPAVGIRNTSYEVDRQNSAWAS